MDEMCLNLLICKEKRDGNEGECRETFFLIEGKSMVSCPLKLYM